MYILDDEASASRDSKQSKGAENNFFDQVGGDVNKKLIKRKRKSIHSFVGGKALEGELKKK